MSNNFKEVWSLYDKALELRANLLPKPFDFTTPGDGFGGKRREGTGLLHFDAIP